MRGETAILRFAARSTVVSGIVGAVGIAFLVAMFTSFGIGANGTALVFGRINDICVLVSYLLCAPSVVALWVLIRHQAPAVSALAALLGLGSILAIVVLQSLLIVDALTFEDQVGPVSVALLGLGAWFIVMGYLGSRSGVLVHGTRMGLLAATYVGYPIWALWLGRTLRQTAEPETGIAQSLPADGVPER